MSLLDHEGHDIGFFRSKHWVDLLNKAFEVGRIEIPTTSGENYHLPIFKKGPFKIAYIDFSVSLPVKKANEIIKFLKKNKVDFHFLHYATTSIEGISKKAQKVATLPETIINQLESYDINGRAKLRRDLNRAHKFSVTVMKNRHDIDPDKLYRLYLNTMKIRNGNLRYNLAYFTEICNYAKENQEIDVFTASINSELVGFLVMIIDGLHAHYMHGAYNRDFNKMGLTDLMLEKAILCAKEHGCKSFSLGPSPKDQNQLIRYKEKWGGSTIPQFTLEYRQSSIITFFRSVYIRLSMIKAWIRKALKIPKIHKNKLR